MKTSATIGTVESVRVACQVNGQAVEAMVPTHKLLLDFLREDLALTGAKRACDLQVCGACTVLLDGLPVSSCSVLALEANGKTVETTEGLVQGGTLHPIQQSFIEHGGFQCGFCTAGMVLSTKALLTENPDPTEAEIKEYLHGNICRCTGYKKILESVQSAARQMRG